MIFSLAFYLLALALSTAALPASSPVKSRQQRANVITHCSVPNTAALTFASLSYFPTASHSYEITRKLRAVNASATFFFNGDNYGCIYSNEGANRVKHVFESGHQVASHTWAHRDLTTLSRNDTFGNILEAIQRITGALPAFMRPPYGNHNDLVREVSASRGQSIVLWDFDSGDSVGISVSGQKARYTQLSQRRPSNVLTLNHEVYAGLARSNEVLPHAIYLLQKSGYRLVTVAECLGKSPYQSRKAPATRDVRNIFLLEYTTYRPLL
ncbi:glycoside hydrolase/deacetylase [Coprinopsis marcescibilis]|uniref:Glycoside hydrolase/deacetylase n=1 Tax=Coprinopsis marcescibilis TaxID=230819 RepID=A0A5C3KGZ3_COPMA|nr:glycoside hydrolase/deacetylase [Coprinopsis marcescibilis]